MRRLRQGPVRGVPASVVLARAVLLATSLTLVDAVVLSQPSSGAALGSAPAGFFFAVIEFPGASTTHANDINNGGQIVGSYNNDLAFLKDGQQFSAIEIPGSTRAAAFGINDLEEIVGSFNDDSGAHPFLKDAGGVTILSVPETAARRINNTGSIVSNSFLIVGATVTPLSGPSGTDIIAHGINDAGAIVGAAADASGEHGFVMDGGSFTTFDVPGATTTRAQDINTTGEIVGDFTDSSGTHGFLKDSSGFVTIDFPDAVSTSAFGINDLGEVVGVYNDGVRTRGFLMAPIVCGDGIISSGEECDDGVLNGTSCCSTTCGIKEDDSPCDDGAICTQGSTCKRGVCCGGTPVGCASCEECDPSEGCVARPRAGCRRPVEPFQAVLQIKDGSNDDRDSVVWDWRKGGATPPGALGDPLAQDDYALCIYTEVGPSPDLILRATAPAGSECDGDPCWRIRGGHLRYRDRKHSADGLKTIQPRPGENGDARVLVKGQGPNLEVPSLPLEPPLTVQLQVGQGDCWEAAYSSAGIERNDATQFKGKAE